MKPSQGNLDLIPLVEAPSEETDEEYFDRVYPPPVVGGRLTFGRVPEHATPDPCRYNWDRLYGKE